MAVTGFGRPVIRLLIGLIVAGVMLTFFGLKDVFKDMGGSHRDFSDLKLEEFREGDVIHGSITEVLGCVATVTSKKDGKVSAVYYAVPFFDSYDNAVPKKIILYRTGNSGQMNKLEDLKDETDIYYTGGPAPTTAVDVERAEVEPISAEESRYFNDYVNEYVEWLVEGRYTKTQINDLKEQYRRAIVPYVVKFHAKSAVVMLPIGLVLIGIAVLIIVFIVVPGRGTKRPALSYVPPATVSGELYSSPTTGTPTSGSGTYSGGLPRQVTTSSGLPVQSGGAGMSQGSGTTLSSGMPAQMQQIYSQGRTTGASPTGSGQGMPSQLQSIYSQRQSASSAVSGQTLSPEAQRILSYEKKPDRSFEKQSMFGARQNMFGTGRANTTAEQMQKILSYERPSGRSQAPFPTPSARRSPSEVFYGKKNYSDMERPLPPLEGEQGAGSTWQSRSAGQPNIYGSNVPPFVPPSARPEKGDSMPSVDPHSEAHIDLSNGGIALEERSQLKAQMPMNGALPVINPESADTAFDREIGSQLPQMPKAPEMPTVGASDESLQIKPLELKDRYSTDQFRVEPTEDYQHLQKYVEAGSGQMQSVDPYTEKNVDLSNGGRELPDDIPDEPAAVAPAVPTASARVSLEKPKAASAAPAAARVSLEKAPQVAEVPQIKDEPVTFAEIPKVQDVQTAFSEIPKVQDIPTVQSVPTVQDVPKAADFPTVPDYSSSYARPEFPSAPTFPDKIETPEFPKAPEFPEKDDSGKYTF